MSEKNAHYQKVRRLMICPDCGNDLQVKDAEELHLPIEVEPDTVGLMCTTCNYKIYAGEYKTQPGPEAA